MSDLDSLIVLLSRSTVDEQKRIVGFAPLNRLPATYPWREYIEAGGLVHYGPGLPGMQRRAATYVDKILKGAKPADLPVEQPTKFDLVITLKSAKTLASRFPRRSSSRPTK